MKRVLIVDDSKVMRYSLERFFAMSADYDVIAAIENAANAEIVCMGGEVDLILMDVCTAEDESGIAAAARIKRHYPEIRIVIMTAMPEHSFVEKARKAGCDSFWYKEHGDVDLMEVCDRTVRGESVWPQTKPVLQIGCTESSEFTERELDIIRGLARGCKYEEIAQQLGITVNTVKYHIKNLMQKTGYHNTLQLVATVVEKRLILPKY